MIGRRRVSRRRLLWMVFAAALLLRLLYLWEARENPFFAVDNLGLDARYYHLRAQEILGEGLVGDDAYFMGPLYPHFLAAIYGAAGVNVTVVRILQAVLAALVPVLLYRIGSRLFTPTVALVAAIAATLYGPFLFYVGGILYTTLAIVLILWIIDRLTAVPSRRPGLHRLLTGILFGLAVVGKGNFILFLPFAVLGIAWGAGEKIRWDRRAPLLFLAGFLVVVGSVTARNYASSGVVVLITSNGGLNFYIGNGPESDGGYRCPKGLDVNEDPAGKRLLEKQTGAPVTSSRASRIWMNRAVRWIGENPGAEAGLLLRKAVFTFSSFEIPQIEIYPVQMRYSKLITYLHIPYGLIVPLGLAATVFLRKRKTFLPVAFLYSYALSIVLFFVVTRYRLPMVPILFLFAGYLVVALVTAARAREWRRLAIGVAWIVPFFLLSNVNLYHVVPKLGEAEAHFRLGLIREREGDAEGAMIEYRACIAEDSEYLLARVNLGVLHALRGETDDAERYLREAIRIDPDYPKANLNLGTILYRSGRPDEGRAYLERAVRIEPEYGKAWYHLAVLALLEGAGDAGEKTKNALSAIPAADPSRHQALELRGRVGEVGAIESWRESRNLPRALEGPVREALVAELLQDRPDVEGLYRRATEGGDVTAMHLYALFLLRTGRLPEAAPLFEQVAEGAGDIPYLNFGLGVVSHDRGRPDEAIEFFERETRYNPGFIPAWKNAAILNAQAGRMDEARAFASEYVKRGGAEDPAIRSLLPR